ncbi:YrvL family regulatory protein [Bacillus swezeyi]|uniref:YrvL family regulatory protein n=1 Tax=Bacillus swezeyi TaxID=1925020 RepID=UPI003F8B493D
MKPIAVVSLSVIFVFIAHFLGISILFHLPGAFYESIGSLLLFTMLYVGLSFLIEPAEKLIISRIKLISLNKWAAFFAAEMTTILFLWAAVFAADELLEDILLTTSAEVLIAVSFFAVDKWLYPQLQKFNTIS